MTGEEGRQVRADDLQPYLSQVDQIDRYQRSSGQGGGGACWLHLVCQKGQGAKEEGRTEMLDIAGM